MSAVTLDRACQRFLSLLGDPNWSHRNIASWAWRGPPDRAQSGLPPEGVLENFRVDCICPFGCDLAGHGLQVVECGILEARCRSE